MIEQKFITFLSDFGYADDFVGTCHGVVKMLAPEVEIIDITHGIRPQGILQGALVLEQTLPYMPLSVILAVVDPGVGAGRKPVAVRTAENRFLIGPDNGLLSLAAAKLGGAVEAIELTCSPYSMARVCKTFEGRDLFAPAAAHLCRGVAIEKLGQHISTAELQQVELPAPEIAADALTATVVYVDAFGNVQLYLTEGELESTGARRGNEIEVGYGDETWKVPYVYTFADVAPGGLLVYEDSYQRITFA
ncbi:MAG: SAM hydrolase/SAM-dependent halogenase family protein, partial [Thermoleophilia bacterium]